MLPHLTCDPSDLEDLKSKCALNQLFSSNVFVLPRSVLLLLKNPTFIFLCLAGATEATLIAGMSTFGPKFLESQFSLSASEAATFFGKETTSLQCFPILTTNRRTLLACSEWRQMLCSLIMDWLSSSAVRIISCQHTYTQCISRAASTDIRRKCVTSVAICYPLEEGKIIVIPPSASPGNIGFL